MMSLNHVGSSGRWLSCTAPADFADVLLGVADVGVVDVPFDFAVAVDFDVAFNVDVVDVDVAAATATGTATVVNIVDTDAILTAPDVDFDITFDVAFDDDVDVNVAFDDDVDVASDDDVDVASDAIKIWMVLFFIDTKYACEDGFLIPT